jgi:hypothetical protein
MTIFQETYRETTSLARFTAIWSTGASEPISLVELAISGTWSLSMAHDPQGLVSWRTALALMLREVDIAPIAAAIWPVLEGMAQQIVERVGADLALGSGRPFRMSYFDWLEQFDHWHDPVRALLQAIACMAMLPKLPRSFRFSGLGLR